MKNLSQGISGNVRRFVHAATLILLPVLSAFSQSNFQPGLVVTKNGDTLRGFIDHKDWTRNPRTFSFKKNKTDEAMQEMNARAVRFFQVEADAFVCYEGTISMDQNSLKLADIPSYEEVSDTIFLKVIASGELVELFQYRDKLKIRFFISVRGSKAMELIYRYYIVQRDGRSGVTDIRTYRSQLLTASAETNSLTDDLKTRIRKSSYIASNLAAIVDLINSKDGKVPTTKKSKEAALIWYAGGGVNFLSPRFATNVYSTLPQNSSLPGPYGNIGFDLLGNRDVGKIVFRTELSVGLSSLDIQSPDLTSNYRGNQLNASLGAQLLYNFYNTRKLKIYVAPGVRINRSFYNNPSYQTITGNLPTDFNEIAFFYSFVLQGGVLINQKFEITVSFAPQLGIAISDFPYWTQAWDYARFGVNYHFSK